MSLEYLGYLCVYPNKEWREWPCTVGMNENGSMKNKEFEHYIDNSIVPLFPDLEDMPGKCILLKFNSGCSPIWRDLLNKCWFRGVYILHLPQPAQLYLYAAGDGHQLLSIQGCCSKEPIKDCNDMLSQRDHNVPRNFHIWVDCLRWSLP